MSATQAVRPDTRAGIVVGNGRRLLVPREVDPMAQARLMEVVDGE